ncbi:uncharacterized protein LOC134932282 isoform X2 [Pseudophryne corroboree]
MAECEVQTAEVPSLIKEEAVQRPVTTQQKQLPRLCRFYSQGRYCQFGRRCRFLHQRLDASALEKNIKPALQCATAEESGVAEVPAAQSNSELNPLQYKNHPETTNRQYRNRRPCRYFVSGYCSMEGNCRFWHPEKLPSVRDDHSGNKKPSVRNKVVPQAVVPEEIRAANLTAEMAAQLRTTEISQLLKRFPKDKVIIQEREDGKVTYYRVTVEPTDPDWPFDLKEIEILLEFPEDYPLQVFTILIPEDQGLPSIMGRHVCEASKEWIEAKHATNQLIGKVELLFRPFLHWLDRNMERLFTEGARLLKRDIDVEKAGLEFVPYQQLQAIVAVKSSEDENVANSTLQETEECPVEDLEDDDSESWVSCDDDDLESDRATGATDGMTNVEGGAGAGPRKGTEIRFLGLKLGEGVGTLLAHRIALSLQCSRCKVTADLSLTEKQPCTAQCDKCNSHISGTFHPSILHQYTTVLGYVDIQGAVAKDLILLESTFMIGCLNCSHEEPLQNLTFGIIKDLNCLHCHSKLSICIEAAILQKLERYPKKASGNKDLNGFGRKTIRDPSIQHGKPLIDNGTCRHFRKSCRWLRFPCCGKTYPCDVCHIEAEDHESELATRMLCGFCAKEQMYSNRKPCISCGNMMNRNINSIHWEGGKGCRSKVKMSRKDRQKYTNCSKTVSRKTVSKK